MSFIEKVRYNIDHRNMVKKIEKEYKNKVSLLTRFHDLDKLIMICLFIPNEYISKIHRFWSWHHPNNKIGWFRLEEAIFDWESARFTKTDKPLNARETCLKYYPELKEKVFLCCDHLNIK